MLQWARSALRLRLRERLDNFIGIGVQVCQVLGGALVVMQVASIVKTLPLSWSSTQARARRIRAGSARVAHGKRNVPSTIVTDEPPIHVLPRASS
jgi:hypothetical protein